MKKPNFPILLSFLLLLIIIVAPSVLGASQSSLVRLTGGFVGEDFKCEAIYSSTPSSAPVPMWFWYGQGGSIDNDQGNVLPRSKFSRGQNIMCKYLDPANGQNLELSTIIPNAPPSIEPMQNMEVKKGKILTLNPIVEDPDGDEVSIIYSEPFDSTGKWEANIQDSIGTYNVTITAIDPFGASDSVNFQVELTDSLVVERQDYNLQYQNQQIAAQEVQQLGEKRYSKKFTLVKKGTQLELYPDIDPQKSDLSVTRIVFVLNKDKLKVGLDISSLGSVTPIGVTALGGFVYDYFQLLPHDFTNFDLEKAEIEVKVSKSWFTTRQVPPSTIGIFSYDEGVWVALPTTKVVETATDIYYSAPASHFSTFAVASNDEITVKTFPVSVEQNKIIVGAAVANQPDPEDTTDEEYYLKYYGDTEKEKTYTTDWVKFFSIFILVLLAIVVISVFAIRTFANRAPRVSVDRKGNIDGGLTTDDFNEISHGPDFLTEDEIKHKVKKMLGGEREEVEQELKERGIWKDDEGDSREIDVNKELGVHKEVKRNDALDRTRERREERNRRMAEQDEKNRIKYWGEK